MAALVSTQCMITSPGRSLVAFRTPFTHHGRSTRPYWGVLRSCDGSEAVLPEEMACSPASPSQLNFFFPDKRLVEDVQLPCLRECQHFVNLTNGIEAVPQLQRLGLPFSFVRIQSTSCEQLLLEKVMAELDATLLLYLALGHCCLVYDCGGRNKKQGAPRAVWYGLEFIRYALTRLWLPSAAPEAYLRGHRVNDAFEAHVRGLTKATKRRLRYYAKYISPEGLHCVRLYGVYRATDHDDDIAFYQGLIQRALPVPAQRQDSPIGGGNALQATPVAKPAGKAGAAATQDGLQAALSNSRAAGTAADSSSSSSRRVDSKVGQPCLQHHQQHRGQRQGRREADMLSGTEGALPQSQQQAQLQPFTPAELALPGGRDAAAAATLAEEAMLTGDPHHAVESLLGMRLFLGGLSHAGHRAWRQTLDEEV